MVIPRFGLRRPARGGGSPGGVIVPPVVSGIELGAAPQLGLLATGAGLGLRGSLTGFWVRMLFVLRSQAVAAGSRFVAANFGTPQGWLISTSGLNASLEFLMIAASGPAARVLTGADIDKLIDATWVFDQPANRVRPYFQGIAGATVTPTGPYRPLSAGTRMSGLARESGAVYATGCGIVAFQGGDGFIPSAAEVAAAHAATVANVAAGLPPFGLIAGKTTWSTNMGPAWNPPTSLIDSVGAQDWQTFLGPATDMQLFQIPINWAA